MDLLIQTLHFFWDNLNTATFNYHVCDILSETDVWLWVQVQSSQEMKHVQRLFHLFSSLHVVFQSRGGPIHLFFSAFVILYGSLGRLNRWNTGLWDLCSVMGTRWWQFWTFFSRTLSAKIVVVHLRVFKKVVICICKHSVHLCVVDSLVSVEVYLGWPNSKRRHSFYWRSQEFFFQTLLIYCRWSEFSLMTSL